ncbi:MAG: translation initiation factor IF-2 [Kiritimatiellaeota bacterium]|nr:translation initiation factor IF-2 [Kiritimatiellota bacterium]
MSDRVRVYDLARELGLSNRDLLALLEQEGIEAKSHSSSIDGEFAELIREHVTAERKKREAAAMATLAPVEGTAEPTGARVGRGAAEEEDEEDEAERPELHLKPPIIVRDLAEALGCKPNELIGELMGLNVFAAINQVVEPEIAARVCERHGFALVAARRGAGSRKQRARRPTPEAVDEAKVPRPPVVAFLGHVDHGKTSLQDAIRKTHVADSEIGGITQHIGASVVRWQGNQITFIDTPGHEAFTAMRARGANATDIVVLVVAADDGVMPQTVEAINHAQAAEVPIVVAINKMDLPGAKPDRVMLQLQEQGLALEEWGGDVGVVRVSAATGEGIDDLLERILLEAEVMELRGNPDIPGRGVVIEAQLETGMGPTANVLVRNGSIHVGDPVLAGACWGRVRALIDHRGKRVRHAGPSTPVKVLGLSGVPEAGEAISVPESEVAARQEAEERQMERRTGELSVARHTTLEDLFQEIEERERKELNVIVKADTRGSVEAIIDSLGKIQSEKISIRIIHSGAGEVTENDVLLASASDAIVLGFHVRAMPGVNRLAKHEGVEIRLYGIIYELIEDVKDALRGRLGPERREVSLGRAEILQVFQVSKTGKICGCRVLEGVVEAGCNAKVVRNDEVIYNGTIQSLRHFQDTVQQVRAGQECGIRLDNFEDFEVGDLIQVSRYVETAPEL